MKRPRVNTVRRRRQPISRAALKSLAPLNLDIPVNTPEPAPPTSLYLAVLSHLADLESRLHTSASASALQLLHQLRTEVVAFFSFSQTTPDEYDFEYDLGLAALLDLDLDLTQYGFVGELSLEEAKNKLVELSSLGDAKVRFGAIVEDAKNRFAQWAMPDLSAHMPDLSNVHMPDLSTHMPDLSDLSTHMPDLPAIDISTLHARLAELRAALPADLGSATDKLVSFVENLIEDDADGDVSWVDARWKGLNMHPTKEKQKEPVDMHALAVLKSAHGTRLIRFEDLPEKWRNNEFVHWGYRFIPGARWGALVWSMFQIHNETANIHTHLVPLMAILSVIVPWSYLSASTWEHPFFSFSSLEHIPLFDRLPSNLLTSILSFTPLPPSPADTLPKSLFLLAAGACLLCSTVWHTLAGCSDFWLLEAGARVDYVGIGWLISASVSGVMYYGFACQPAIMRMYITVAIMTGIAGSILPFQGWFNERRNKKWRIAFFLVCACSAIVPLGHLSYRHSFGRMWEFISPVVPSLVSYLTGLVFYATHFPECCFPGRFDWAGSHAIWHVFIVIAIREHWKATAAFHETSHAFSCVAR